MNSLEHIKAANANPTRAKKRAALILRFEVTPTVHEALEQLRASGYFGGPDASASSVADELLRWALREHREFLR